jgi:hypothetical protein
LTINRRAFFVLASGNDHKEDWGECLEMSEGKRHNIPANGDAQDGVS